MKAEFRKRGMKDGRRREHEGIVGYEGKKEDSHEGIVEYEGKEGQVCRMWKRGV